MRLADLSLRDVVRAALLIPWAATAPHASGGTYSMNPTANAFVTAGPGGTDSGNNYGAAGALGISASGLSQGQFQTVMKFNLSLEKSSFDSMFGAGNWSIQSAALQLTASTPSNNTLFNANASGNFTISFMQNNAWAEGTGTPNAPTTDGITFNTLPTYVSGSDPALGTYTFAGGNSGAATYTLGLPTAFASDVSSGGIASLRLFAADSTVSYLFNSRNFGTASSRPLLTVTAVPEPAGAASLVAAIVAACLFSRAGRRIRG